MKHLFMGIFTLITIKLFKSVITVPKLSDTERKDFQVFSRSFNGEIDFCRSIARLKDRFKLTMTVETGTNYGYTTRFLESIFKKIDTFEINKERFNSAVARSTNKNLSNYHSGNSGEILVDVLKDVPSKRILFYLDPHWGSYWPLRDEIKTNNSLSQG